MSLQERESQSGYDEIANCTPSNPETDNNKMEASDESSMEDSDTLEIELHNDEMQCSEEMQGSNKTQGSDKIQGSEEMQCSDEMQDSDQMQGSGETEVEWVDKNMDGSNQTELASNIETDSVYQASLQVQYDAIQSLDRTSSDENSTEVVSDDENNDINQKSGNNSCDDISSSHIVKQGEIVVNRYVVASMLGEGCFGRVVSAFDVKEQSRVAIKIARNIQYINRKAQMEIKLLQKIKQCDPNNVCISIVKLIDHFIWKGHTCMVFNRLYQNLSVVLGTTGYEGVSLKVLKRFGQNLCSALNFLRKPELKIIHCDLKLDNIVLYEPDHESSPVTIIDFGNACRLGQNMNAKIQALSYRAPEVMLGQQYDAGVDMWSLACILVEMHTGRVLFHAWNDKHQFGNYMEVLGEPPEHVLNNSPKVLKFFDVFEEEGKYIPKQPKDRPYKPPGSGPLKNILGVETGGPRGIRQGEEDHSQSDYLKFENLILRMLDFDIKTRITPCEALKHEFFN